MKKFFTTLLILSTFATAAWAYQGIAIKDLNGKVTVQPLQRNCDEPQPTAAGATSLMGYCDSDGHGCPVGFVPLKKYCWGGWKHGFYHCGTACKERSPDCVWGHNGYICDNGTGPR